MMIVQIYILTWNIAATHIVLCCIVGNHKATTRGHNGPGQVMGGREGLPSVTKRYQALPSVTKRYHEAMTSHALQHVDWTTWRMVLPRLDIGFSRCGGLQTKQSEGQGVHGAVPSGVQQEGPSGALPSHCHGSAAALNGATAPVQLPSL